MERTKPLHGCNLGVDRDKVFIASSATSDSTRLSTLSCLHLLATTASPLVPKSFAAYKSKLFEPSKGLSQKHQIIVCNRHTLQIKLLEPRVGTGHGSDPWREVGPPVGQHQIEVRKPRLPLPVARQGTTTQQFPMKLTE